MDEESKFEDDQRPTYRHSTPKVGLCSVLGITTVLLLAVASISGLFLKRLSAITCSAETAIVASGVVSCIQPSLRREWRTLSKPDKDAYISAVQCLSSKSSKLRENGTLYDDFPWVHKLTAPIAHKSAPFFPWHRYYIHSYEKTLRDDCGFQGSLPYWDWSADWNNFEKAPVFDSEDGFGGDGSIDGETTVGEGRCVTDGKFAGLEAMFYDDKYQPHCLSRGFQTGEELNKLTELIKPDAVDSLMNEPDFGTFSHELERRAHTFISHSIRGDFSKYTGPYDPIFFLHHANLDRLWAKWQKLNPHRQFAYHGKATSLTSEPATVEDMLYVGGLLKDTAVSEVMRTTSGPLCYEYM